MARSKIDIHAYDSDERVRMGYNFNGPDCATPKYALINSIFDPLNLIYINIVRILDLCFWYLALTGSLKMVELGLDLLRHFNLPKGTYATFSVHIQSK